MKKFIFVVFVILFVLSLAGCGGGTPKPEKWCRLVLPVVLQDYPQHVPAAEDQVLLGIGSEVRVARYTEIATPRGNTDPTERYYQTEFDLGGGEVVVGFVPETACEVFFVIPVEK